MEAHLEEPLARAELARRAGLSSRQLERLFRRYLGRTPTRYYLELRLHRARALLTQTSLSILNVALACGFVSASHFSKCYREFFHKMPRQERPEAARGPATAEYMPTHRYAGTDLQEGTRTHGGGAPVNPTSTREGRSRQ